MVEAKTNPKLIEDLRKQVEFYLSEDNLKKDKFFNDMMKEHKGYLPLEKIMNCNKVKNMTKDVSKLVEAIKTSEKLELDADGKSVARKGNPPLPELIKTGKRRKEEEDDKETSEFLKDQDLNDPVIMEMTGPKEPKNSWRQVENAYKEKFKDRKVLYSRFDAGKGHMVVSSFKHDPAKIAEELKIKLDEEEFTIKKLEGEGLEKFWAEHGAHYNLCANKKLSLSSIGKNKSSCVEIRRKKAEKEKQNPKISVTLGDYTYDDINKIKSKARVILNLKKNGDILDEAEKKFVTDLLQYHSKATEKLRDLKDVCVDNHPTFANTRCFIIIRKDGSKEDFSVAKCIDNIKEKARVKA